MPLQLQSFRAFLDVQKSTYMMLARWSFIGRHLTVMVIVKSLTMSSVMALQIWTLNHLRSTGCQEIRRAAQLANESNGTRSTSLLLLLRIRVELVHHQNSRNGLKSQISGVSVCSIYLLSAILVELFYILSALLPAPCTVIQGFWYVTLTPHPM